MEYFRGKDFARYFRANPEKLNLHVPPKPGEQAHASSLRTLERDARLKAGPIALLCLKAEEICCMALQARLWTTRSLS